MFASILRRWRLVTPLALMSLLLMMVAGGMLTPAAAQPARGRLHFAFAGDAAGMVDLTVNPVFVECFSGQLESNSVDLDATAIHESGCANENLDSIDGLSMAHADATEATIKSDHTKTQGHVITDVINFGSTAIFGFDDAPPNAEANLAVNVPCNIIINPDGSFTCVGSAIGGDVNAGDFAHVRAEAECEKKHGRVAGHASVAALSSFDDLDMEFVTRTFRTKLDAAGHPVIDPVTGVPVVEEIDTEHVRELKPSPFVFSKVGGGSVQYVTQDEDGGTIVLIVNETSVIKSDDFAAISANALHFIEQNGAGFRTDDILYTHAFAQIHCHSGTFSFEDTIGA